MIHDGLINIPKQGATGVRSKSRPQFRTSCHVVFGAGPYWLSNEGVTAITIRALRQLLVVVVASTGKTHSQSLYRLGTHPS